MAVRELMLVFGMLWIIYYRPTFLTTFFHLTISIQVVRSFINSLKWQRLITPPVTDSFGGLCWAMSPSAGEPKSASLVKQLSIQFS